MNININMLPHPYKHEINKNISKINIYLLIINKYILIFKENWYIITMSLNIIKC